MVIFHSYVSLPEGSCRFFFPVLARCPELPTLEVGQFRSPKNRCGAPVTGTECAFLGMVPNITNKYLGIIYNS